MSKLFSFLFGARPQAVAGIREDLKTASISQLVDWSRHDDGFIRERVLVRAVELRSPELLDAIVERLNDWVPQVRQTARTALLTLVPLLPPSAILKTLPAIDRLRIARRENHVAWIGKYHATVIDALGGDALIAEAVVGTGEIARACFDIVKANSLLEADQFAQRVLDNGADFGTSLAAWRLGSTLEESKREKLAEIGLTSSFGAVRTVALRELITSAGKQVTALAEQSLLDPQSSVREVAMWYLKQNGYPVAQFYVDSLTRRVLSMRTVRICLASLAACGTHDHAAIVKRFADSSHARTQAAAVVSWTRLAPESRDEILRFALRSEFPRVRKLALVLMDDFGAYIDLDEALTLAGEKSDHTLVLSLARREPWTWITTILKMASSEVDLLDKEDLSCELRNWLAASANFYTKPTVAHARDLALPETRRALEELVGHDVFSANGKFRHIFELHGLAR
jgi:hypothetical protein